MTYHVGEAFRHLLSGLRAIDEVLRFLNPQPGDSISHGIVLGLDPAVWLQQIGSQILHFLLDSGDALQTAQQGEYAQRIFFIHGFCPLLDIYLRFPAHP
jgi:hypothetical protein